MARPVKIGLDYFPMDTDILSNRQIKRLISEFGSKGFIIYVALLCLIYHENGYWVRLSDELPFDIAEAVKSGVTEELVSQVITGCIRLGLFDERLATVSKVLTGSGIQERYLLAKRGAVIAAEMRVITVKTRVIAAETPVIAAISTQSKVKEIKEKESKGNLTPPNDNPPKNQSEQKPVAPPFAVRMVTPAEYLALELPTGLIEPCQRKWMANSQPAVKPEEWQILALWDEFKATNHTSGNPNGEGDIYKHFQNTLGSWAGKQKKPLPQQAKQSAATDGWGSLTPEQLAEAANGAYAAGGRVNV